MEVQHIFSIVRTNLRAWLNVLCRGANEVSAERGKSGITFFYRYLHAYGEVVP